ncbi:eukaryotic-like serine/threonine-protein kinase [Staphylococcus auricularis]
MIGKMINERYHILEKLGGGGMSTVYLAQDTILQRKVAIKAISIPSGEQEKTIQRFEREVHHLTQLAHDHIVDVYDITEDDECFFLVMEYVEGPTLSQYIKSNHPIPVETVVEFTNQIIDGIAHAHECHIVHRDIKPQNILFANDHELKLLDFGIAKVLSETTMTKTNHVLGTVQYLSPEQARGESTDYKTDIYSIGVVIYEMLMGEPPFTGETAISIAIKHIQDPMPNVSDYREDVPQALSNVILKATAKERDRRYESVKELSDDLATALDPSRKDEQPLDLYEDQNQTMVIDKQALQSKLKDDEAKSKNIKQTMQIPVVDQLKLQSNESQFYVEPTKKRSPFKKIIFALIFIFLLIGLIGFGAWGMFGHKYAETPDVSGKTEQEAKQALEEQSLKLGKVSHDYSNKYAKDKIIRTNPESGERVERDSAIDIVVSKGVKQVTMPNLCGMKREEAVTRLEELGIKDVKVNKAYTTQGISKGFIESQNVYPGSKVKVQGGNVILTESLGVKQVYVGNYINKSYNTAKQELENKGFKVNITEKENSNSVKKGDVISQSPKNKEVDEGSTINFVVSEGKASDKDQSSDKDSDKEKKDDKKESKNDSKQNDEDNDNNSDNKSSGPESAATKDYVETVEVPYSGKNDKSQEVEVFVRDKNKVGNEPSQTYNIKSDKSIEIPLEIEKDKTAGYTVRVDGKVVADKDIPYDK